MKVPVGADEVRVPWKLSLNMSRALDLASSLLGVSSSEVMIAVLTEALHIAETVGDTGPLPVVERVSEFRRRHAHLILPRELVVRVDSEAARRGCSTLALVEHLWSQYGGAMVGRLVSESVAPMRVAGSGVAGEVPGESADGGSVRSAGRAD